MHTQKFQFHSAHQHQPSASGWKAQEILRYPRLGVNWALASAATEVKIFGHQPSKKQFESVEAKQAVDACGHQMLSFLLDKTCKKSVCAQGIKTTAELQTSSAELGQYNITRTTVHEFHLSVSGSNWL